MRPAGVLSSTAHLKSSFERTCCARSVAMYLRHRTEAVASCRFKCVVTQACNATRPHQSAIQDGVSGSLTSDTHSRAYQGATVLTRMPSFAHSHAKLRVSWFIAAAKHSNGAERIMSPAP